MRANPFSGFSYRQAHEKRDTTKSHRDLRGIPNEQNLTTIGIWVGVADVINPTKFGNDRSGE